MPKSHDLGHVRGHVIRMSKLPKIAKIDSVRPAYHTTPVPFPALFVSSAYSHIDLCS
jgi:hypothetical protein